MQSTLEKHAHELRTCGYTIVENVLDRAEIDEANAALDTIFEQEKEIGPQRRWHNSTYKVAYMLPQKSPFFLSFPFNPRVLPLMRLLLGNDCVVGSLNGLSMTPGGESQKLQLDQNESVPGTELTINALQTLDPCTKENAGTRVEPCTQ
ncbi:MAG: hypothetical protein JWN98_1197, partial [Abditibacteriota bacterium]|nr:hypothetical protein [Abditibacteriota bacterium]